MGNRADEIRKRIAKRKRENSSGERHSSTTHDESQYDTYGPPHTSYGSHSEKELHPLFKKEVFLFKVLLSAVMVLSVAVLYRMDAPYFNDARGFVQNTMENEFQFAMISEFYEEQFGQPLALFPESPNESTEVTKEEVALPAVGKVIENFESNGKGIMVQTAPQLPVEAMKGGLVVFAGKKDDLGETVIIQHSDKSESWYGHLEDIQVNAYEAVSAGAAIGTVSTNTEGQGEFYFAIKQDQAFIDPIQVMTFD
ncbi:peptidase M23 [Bacillus coahuilensis m2-6]|uniref:M23 family metallopeptidase n=1 Tax=Bacillus coahuilensis TaxID=408580 RepID=UPI0007506A33|nr:M23 family metallopeptidase [Bacillus coahuilensis]KUP06960.1 peptidase M23 [Bacillus coahuilensis m2-6]